MDRIELDEIVERMVEMMGMEKLLIELTQAQDTTELQANLEHIDRMNELDLM